MKKIITLSIFLFVASINIAQTVTTLVTGPSTFNDGLALDKEGNIYAARFYSSTVTKITPDGSTSIFANGFNDPNGIAFDNSGNLLVPNASGGKISKVSPSGEVSTFKNILSPHAVLVDKDDNVYVAHYPTNKISKINPSGITSTFWSGNGLNGPIGLLKDANGNFYAGNFDDGKIHKRTPSGEITQIGDIPGWMGFMTLAGDAIYATAFQRHRIYKVPVDGSGQTIFAGTGSAGKEDGDISTATFNGPNGIVATSTGDTLYISDYNTRSLRMITGINGITDINEQESVIDQFELKQNYPNPFNPNTQITFSVNESNTNIENNIQLNVYDVLGNEVARLIDERKSSGTYTINFDGSDLSSGVYFYRLITGNYVQSKKMILLK